MGGAGKMKRKIMVILGLLLALNICTVWAGQYSFSGYGKRGLFGSIDKSRMWTVSFSVDETLPSSEIVATLRFVNTGNSPIKGDPFFSQTTQIVSKEGKTYEVPWATGMVVLKDGSKYEIPGAVTPEKVEDVVANHPELRKPSPFEALLAPLEDDSEAASKNKVVRLINPGGEVEKVLYIQDPLIRTVIVSKNVKSVILNCDMGEFVLDQQS